MKRAIPPTLGLLFVLSLSGIGAKADTPTINVMSPANGSTIFATTWPFSTNLTFTISHTPLSDLNVLDVRVDGTSILPGGVPIGNPFDSGGCRPPAWPSPLACSTADANNATITVPWSVALGTHTISFTVRHGGQGVELEEVEVTVVLVNAEYPAPPAIANAYINQTYKSVAPKRRGCVISQIAEYHAKDQRYNAPPGPYDVPLVQADVDTLISSCGS